MNREHLELCSSAEWAEMIGTYALPWATDGLDLGDDVLEVGPGFGAATEPLSVRVPRLTGIEIDERLARELADRYADTERPVTVVQGDATRMPFPDRRFSSAVSFTMLHHVPSAELQDRLFAEVARVLRPGAPFAGTDSMDGVRFRALHEQDVCVPVDPARFGERLERAGFERVEVEAIADQDEAGAPDGGRIRFRGWTRAAS